MSRRELGARVALAAFLSTVAWWLFHHYAQQILAAKPPPNPMELAPWLRRWSRDHDGLEMPVALVGSFTLVGLSFLVAKLPMRFGRFLPWPVQVLLALPTLYVVGRTSLGEFELGAAARPIFLAAGVSLIVSLGLHALTRVMGRWKPLWWALGVLAAVGIAIVAVIGVNYDGTDWSYFTAPAKKLLQGERLGSFYMQYNVLTTGLFALLMGLGARIHQLSEAMGLVFGLWYLLYVVLAKQTLKRPALIAGFMLALLALRFFTVRFSPIFYPQVSTTRMDLWVPLLVALHHWGLFSRNGALTVAGLYLLDSFFGFFYLGLYLGFVALDALARRKEWKALRTQLAWCVGAPLVAVLVHVALFGGPFAGASSHYASLQLGFLPIDDRSMLWPILVMVALALPYLAAGPEPERSLDLFTAIVVACQLVYFYGRSHDHNLINISGAWVFLVFLLLARFDQRAAQRGRLVVALSVLLSAGALTLSSHRFLEKLNQVEAVVKGAGVAHYLAQPNPIDAVIDHAGATLEPSERLIVWDMWDGYTQYRLQRRHPGHYAPFFANAMLEETAQFLADELQRGTKIIAFMDPSWDVRVFDAQSQTLRARGVVLSVTRRDGFFEVVRAP